MDKEIVELYLDDIIPNRFQPREVFNEEALKELSLSIKEHGVIQPIIVRKIGDKYEIIAGERRYKASAMAGMTKIPAIIRNLDDKESSKVALLENLQRKDLTPIEEARTYHKILELDSLTQEELGRTMGKSQAAIANKMRLLSLPDEIQEALLKDEISERHARSLLNLDNREEQIKMLNKIITNRMTVRELDNEIRLLKNDSVIEQPVIVPSTNSEKINNEVFTQPSTIEIPNPANEFLAPKKEENAFPYSEFTDISLLEKLESDDEIKEEEESEAENSSPKKDPFELEPEKPFEEIDFKQPNIDFDKIDLLLKQTQNYTLKDAINELKTTVSKIQNKGFEIRLEEIDFENMVQIIVKIEKNK